jgi:hypothetical protein
MRNYSAYTIVAFAALLALSPAIFAQAQQQSGAAKAPASTKAFSPQDLSGVWIGQPDGRTAVDDKLRPPMTPWAQARYDAAVPTVGPRDVPGKENDPILHCDPDGIPKLLGVPQPFEIIQIPGRMFMFFEHNHHWRTIWTDGRKLPDDPDPWWMGHSVGHWEGNTLVVESNGFNDIPWLNFFGDPHSDAMRLTERYQRIDHDTLMIAVTIDDPKAYTKTWVNPPKKYGLKDWELDEHYCTIEEETSYGNGIRIPSGASPTQ